MQISDYQYEQLAQIVRKSGRVLLISHRKPDGDTTGSTTAFARWCKEEGKETTIFCKDLPETTFRYLQEVHHYTNDECVFENTYDLVILFDSGDLKIAGVEDFLPKLKPGYTLVNIDHHQTNKLYADINLVEPASSTAEIVYRFFKTNAIEITAEIATSILTGICTDTSNFSNPLTSISAMNAASDLTSRGARFNEIIKHVWNNKTIEGLKTWGKLLERLQKNETFDLVTTYISKEELQSISGEIIEGLTNFLSGVVSDVDTIILLKEVEEGQIRASMRSRNRDISKLAKFFGGGGHKGAAGFTVHASLNDLGIR